MEITNEFKIGGQQRNRFHCLGKFGRLYLSDSFDNEEIEVKMKSYVGKIWYFESRTNEYMLNKKDTALVILVSLISWNKDTMGKPRVNAGIIFLAVICLVVDNEFDEECNSSFLLTGYTVSEQYYEGVTWNGQHQFCIILSNWKFAEAATNTDQRYVSSSVLNSIGLNAKLYWLFTKSTFGQLVFRAVWRAQSFRRNNYLLSFY